MRQTVFLSALTGLLVSAFMSVFAALFFWQVPEGNRETLVYMAGQLSGFTSAAVAYWFNTTFGSNRKTEALIKAEPVKDGA